jgi:azurin
MVLPRDADAAAAILTARALEDPDLHTRLAIVLALADMPASPAIGRALYAASLVPENYGDRWLSRALYIAAHRHRESFLTQYRDDPAAVPVTALPVSLRLGNSRPDWRTPSGTELTADWRDMTAPGRWESRGLPSFDGVVWFTRTIDVPSATAAARSVTFGRLGNTADVWVNGEAVAARAGAPAGRPVAPVYLVPDGVLRNGTNTITLRVQNFRGDGGFLGASGSMYLQLDATTMSLDGTWKYRVERQTNAPTLYAKAGELAAHFALAARTAAAEQGLTAARYPPTTSGADVVIRLGVVPDQLKFDTVEIAVVAGQFVELVIANTDVMPHNFLLGSPGSLAQIGAASDALLATGARAAAQQYVPDVPQVLFSTNLIDPGQTVTVQFRAPAEPGDYPYLCTFPGHWRLMNGVLQVRRAAGGPTGGR